MKISPNTPETLKQVQVEQTDSYQHGKMTVRLFKGGAANQDPRHRSRVKQLEDLRSHLDRVSADVDTQLHAARSSNTSQAPVVHNTIMCVPKIVELLFLIFPPAVFSQEQTTNEQHA